MQPFVVWWGAAWLAGLASGVFGITETIVLGMAAWGGTAAWWQGQRIQAVGVVFVLVLLGCLYSDQVQTRSVAAVTRGCVMVEAPSSGVITGQPDIEPLRVQYTVRLTSECTALVTAARYPVYTSGDTIALKGGELQPIGEMPEELAGYRGYLERQGVGATWRYPEVSRQESAEGVRTRVHEWFDRSISTIFVEPDASIVRALLLAERGLIPEALTEQFRRAGVSHVLAISGLHVSLLVGIFLAVALLVPVSPLVRTLTVLSILWVYVWFIGAPLSAQRAAWFWSFFLIALRMRVLVSLPTVLLATAVVVGTRNPLLLQEVGLQLSLAAVAGIFGMLFVTRPYMQRLSSEWRSLVGIGLVSLGAGLATWPLTVFHFGTVSLVGVVANVLVVPVVPFVLGGALVAVGVSVLSSSVAMLVAWAIHIGLRWMEVVTRLVSGWPGAAWEELSLSGVAVVTYYIGIGVVAYGVVRWQQRSWREVWE